MEFPEDMPEEVREQIMKQLRQAKKLAFQQFMMSMATRFGPFDFRSLETPQPRFYIGMREETEGMPEFIAVRREADFWAFAVSEDMRYS